MRTAAAKYTKIFFERCDDLLNCFAQENRGLHKKHEQNTKSTKSLCRFESNQVVLQKLNGIGNILFEFSVLVSKLLNKTCVEAINHQLDCFIPIEFINPQSELNRET